MRHIRLTSLLESYKNFIGFDEEAIKKKEKWADEVWDMLQKSYAAIGGIKGSGFGSKKEMIHKIPFWKLKTRNGQLKLVVMYKDKGGRKSVAIGTDGSDEAKKLLAKQMKEELKRSFGEKSSAALGFTLKNIPWPVIEPFIQTPRQAQKTLGPEKDVIPIDKFDISKLSSGDMKTYKRFDFLRPYFYVRQLGDSDQYKLKVMIGTPGLKIR